MLTTKGVHIAARGVPQSLLFLYHVCPLIVLTSTPTNENERARSWPGTEARLVRLYSVAVTAVSTTHDIYSDELPAQ